MTVSSLSAVLQHYRRAIPSAEQACIDRAAGGGGLSGAEVWRVGGGRAAAAGASTSEPLGWALRAWPLEHPTAERLAWMHEVLQAAGERLAGRLPVPLAADDGRTFVEAAGRRWEVAPWLAGSAAVDGERLSTERIEAAVRLLAEFHLAARELRRPCPGWEDWPNPGPSPGLVERRGRLDALLRGGRERLLRAATEMHTWPRFSQIAARWAAAAVHAAPRLAGPLDAACRVRLTLSPCIRDVKRDHVLFVGDRATGLIDFGALRTETVACDLGRLAPSLAEDEESVERAVDAYAAVRPLEPVERGLVDLFDATGLLLGGANWIEWVAVEGRRFADRSAVERRFLSLVERLERRLERPFDRR